MDKKALIEKTREMQAAGSCYVGLKDAGQAWIDAVGTEKEPEAAKSFIAELEADVMRIEDVIAFMESPEAAQHLGAEKAGAIGAHAREVQAAGGKYCDCPACSAGLVILENREVLLKA